MTCYEFSPYTFSYTNYICCSKGEFNGIVMEIEKEQIN